MLMPRLTGRGNRRASGRKNMIRAFLMAMDSPMERIMMAVRLAPEERMGLQAKRSRATPKAAVAAMARKQAAGKPRFRIAAKNSAK